MTDIQKILLAIAKRIPEEGTVVTQERLETIVDCLNACPSYLQMPAVLAGLGVEEEEENA